MSSTASSIEQHIDGERSPASPQAVPAPASLQDEHHSVPATNKWLVAAAVIVPTILEVVDGTVVTVAMPYIQGSLNAGVDEVAWVLTSYLVANGIVIPLTGWLSGLFGRW